MNPEPLILQRQRMRSDVVDLTCASASSSVLGKLWNMRRRCKFSASSFSVGSVKEMQELNKAMGNADNLSPNLPSMENQINGTQCNAKVFKEDDPHQHTQPQDVSLQPVVESVESLKISTHRPATEHRHTQPYPKRLACTKPDDAYGSKRMRVLTLCELQRIVAKLRQGHTLHEQWLAADEVRRLCKDDPIARVTLGMLGVIAPLVYLLDSLLPKYQCTALLALLNLAVGNESNKAAIVKAKAVPKMVKLLQSPNADIQAAVVMAFLSLSALDDNKAEIGASGAVAMLVTLVSAQHADEQRRKDALRALYNLSIHAENVKLIEDAGGVPLLLAMVSDIDMADKSLATLSNFAVTDVGRQALMKHKELAYAVLVGALQWSEAPKCQERAVYVLMMIAHHSKVQREAMAAAGAIPALLELSLLGTPLAQKRATRTLDSFRHVKAFSAPQQQPRMRADTVIMDTRQSISRTLSEKKVVDGLVLKSLHRTMQRITKRANLSNTLGDMKFEGTVSVTASKSFCRELERRSSSRSLPY